jgi:hypothetical protein
MRLITTLLHHTLIASPISSQLIFIFRWLPRRRGGLRRRRRQPKDRRHATRDLFELADLERAKRAAIDAELDALAIGPSMDLDGARAALEDFGRFWATETSAELRRELLAQLSIGSESTANASPR